MVNDNVSARDFCDLQSYIFAQKIRQIPLTAELCYRRLSQKVYSGGGFLLPVRLITCILDAIRHIQDYLVLCLSYRLHCLYLSLEKDEQGLRRRDYRNDEGRAFYLGYGYRLIHKIGDVLNTFFYLSQKPRNLFGNILLSIPSSAIHCKKFVSFLYLPSPKSVQYLFVLDLAYQHLLSGVGRLPGASTRGHLSLTDYNIGRQYAE